MKWVSGKSYFAIAFRGSIWNMTSWGDTFLEEEVLFFIIPEDEEARTGSWLLYIMAAVWSCSSNPWIVPTMFRFSSIWGAMNTIKIFLENIVLVHFKVFNYFSYVLNRILAFLTVVLFDMKNTSAFLILLTLFRFRRRYYYSWVFFFLFGFHLSS